jgi:hypothetical protein
LAGKRGGLLAILSEGPADAAFLKQIALTRGKFPKFHFFPHTALYGDGAFGNMLKALKGNPRMFERLRGVLIVADSKDEPDATFKKIRNQIRKVDGYRVPDELLAIPAEPIEKPGVFVMLLPDEKTPGALESLYVESILQSADWRKKCLADYLACDKSDVASWSAEKQAKAQFHALVAACYGADPSRAASQVFRSKDDDLIDPKAKCFDDVERRLRAFCEAVSP